MISFVSDVALRKTNSVCILELQNKMTSRYFINTDIIASHCHIYRMLQLK